jgi:hypothetical protein
LRFPSSRTAQLTIPLVSFPQCSKEITSAFFSPITGRYVLQTCMDHTLKLFEVQERQGQAKCKLVIVVFFRSLFQRDDKAYFNLFAFEGIKSIEHNNNVKDWMTAFKAKWHPQREDVILVGSLSDNPRRVHVTLYLF